MAALKHHSIGWGSCFFSKLRQKHCASAGATGCCGPEICLDPGAANSPTITPGDMKFQRGPELPDQHADGWQWQGDRADRERQELR